MKLKSFFKKVSKFVSKLWTKADKLADKFIPVAVLVVEGVKKAMDSPLYDVAMNGIKHIIKGTADNVLIDKANKYISEKLPSLILSLNIAVDISGIKDPKEQVMAILRALKISDSAVQNDAYKAIIADLTLYLSDGKLSVKEVSQLAIEAGAYYDKYIKK